MAMQRREFIASFGSVAATLATPGDHTNPAVIERQRSNTLNTTEIENKRLRDELEGKSRKLTEANTHLSETLTACSAMRVPVTCILGYTDLILENAYGEIPEEVRLALLCIKSSGGQIEETINDVFKRRTKPFGSEIG
jgi:hypothetical protein